MRKIERTEDVPANDKGFIMKKLTRMAIVLNFLYFAARFASRPYISILAVSLGANELQVGIIISLYSIVQVFFALLIGKILDKRGQKLPSAVGAALFVSGTLLMVAAKGLLLTGIATVMLGIAHGTILVSSQSIMTAVPDDKAREKQVGYFYFAASVGAFAGPAIGGYLQDTLGPNLGFLGATFFGIAAFILILFMPNYRCFEGERKTSLTSLLKNKKIIANVLLSALVFFTFDVYSTYFPLYGVTEVGLTSSQVGLIISAGSLAAMVIRPLLGRLCQLFTRQKVFVGSLILGSACIASMGIAKSFYPLLAIALIYGLTYGLNNPLTLITVTEVSTPENRSRIIAMRVMANSSAQTVSPVFFGAIAGLAGLSSVFFGSGILMFGCIYMAGRLTGKRKRRSKEAA